jgi:hypothetical protein
MVIYFNVQYGYLKRMAEKSMEIFRDEKRDLSDSFIIAFYYC